MPFLKCGKASALFYSVIICHIGMCEHEKKCIEISEAEILNYGRRLWDGALKHTAQCNIFKKLQILRDI